MIKRHDLLLDSLVLLLPLAAAAVFYAPVLLNAYTLIHAETVSLGIPLTTMLSQALEGEASALWTSHIFGGHPIHAEGQGAFAHPVNLLLSSLFSPITAYNLAHWVCMSLSIIGVYGLCRALDCSRAASVFAAVAVVFSTLWIGARSNLTVGGSITWIPWALWSATLWLKKPDYLVAALFGLAMALIILAGYPHIFHGTVVYLAIYLLCNLLFASSRTNILSGKLKFLATGALAVVVCIATSAVQLLPLMELVTYSHRSAGVEPIEIGKAPASFYIRGFLFTYFDSGLQGYPSDPDSDRHFPVFGSLLVCAVASCVIFCRRMAPELGGHLIAGSFLIVLGLGVATPLFEVIYKYQLIPGLNSFRIMFPFLFPGVIGISVACAMALDALARRFSADSVIDHPGARSGYLQVAAGLLFWLAVLSAFMTGDVKHIQYGTAGLFAVVLVVSITLNRGNWIPAMSAALLLIEVSALRLDPFVFEPPELIEIPATAVELSRDEDLQDYKVFDATIATTYSFLPPKADRVEEGMRRMLASLSPASSSLWGISSFTGNTALPLERQKLAKAKIERELAGDTHSIEGLRLMDFLSVRYITTGGGYKNAGLVPRYRDQQTAVVIAENQHARPIIQFFSRVTPATSTHQALDIISDMKTKTLVIEPEEGQDIPILEQPGARSSFSYTLRDRRSDRFMLEVSASDDVWLFISDANFPGWQARLNGENVTVYTAQVLGKAIFIPAGEHALSVTFQPTSYQLGLTISCLSLAALVAWVSIKYYRRQRHRATEEPAV